MARVSTQLVIEGKNTSKPAFDQAQRQLFDLEAASKKAGAALAGMFSLTVVASWVRASINAADEARKLAQAAGVTTEAFTGLQWAASQSGVSTNELSAAFSRLNRTAVQAANGGKAQAELFQRLGVSVTNAEGAVRSGDQLLLDLASRFAELPDGAEKSAAAIELFGKSGAKLVPLLNAGADGIGALVEQAERLGLVISDAQAAQAEQFNDSLSTLGAVASGAGNTIAGELLPTLNTMTGLLIDASEGGENAALAATVLGGALKILATLGIAVAATFRNVGRSIGGAAAAAVTAARGNFSEAADILRDVAAENEKTSREAEESIAKIWNGAYEEQGAQAAKSAADIRKLQQQLADEVKGSNEALAKSYRNMVTDARSRLRELGGEERKTLSDIEKIRKDRLDMEKRYADAIAGFRSGSGSGPSFGQFQDARLAAQAALRAGDIEGARQQAQAALKVLQELAAAGENTYGFDGFAKSLMAIEQEASKLEESRADQRLAGIREQIDALNKDFDKIRDVKVDPTLSEEAKQKLIADMEQLAARLGQILTLTATVSTSVSDVPVPATPQFATGGAVRGPGTGTSDSILARLSNGEYVLRAAAVRHYGTGLLDQMNGLAIPQFADGGAVDAAAAAAPAMPNLGRWDISVGGEQVSVLVEQASGPNMRRLGMKFGGSSRRK
ncbi:hypothetical protein [Ectopseudomonas guguanensis]|uniref:hypothetical protein n=1 Tax=Ectopseudomonas guguanensis TaxID=1198456 RepID=UPI0028A6E3FD|nr:hypothetical protein [Pseudomonas guguanensis]